MAKTSLKSIVLVLAALLVVGGLLLPAAQPVRAAGPFTVNTLSDTNDLTTADGLCLDAGGKCSLRAAIQQANFSGGATTITVPAGTYTLTLGALDIAPSGGLTFTINGAGAATTILQGGGTDRVIQIDYNGLGGTSVTLSNLTISGGKDTVDHIGAAGIYAGSVTSLSLDHLTLQNCAVSGNQVVPLNATSNFEPGGGVLMNGGNLTVSNCTFSNNSAGTSWGGAIAFISQSTAGVLSITNSTFTNNSMANTSGSAGMGGGAVYINSISGPTHTITGSIFNANAVTSSSGGASGGALYIQGGTTNVSNSTFTANSAANLGGAVYVDSGTLNLTFARLTGNTAVSGGSGLYNGTAAAVTLATNDWWGCSGGPGAGGCDTTGNAGGTLTATPWIVVSIAASPNPIFTSAATTVTADVLHNSSAATLTTAQVSTLIGLPVNWTGDPLGTLSATQNTIQANGTVKTTFTAGITAGTATVRAGLDNDSAPASITINTQPADAGVVKTAPASVIAGNNMTYTLTVTNSGPGAAQGITLTDNLPFGVTLVSQNQVSGPSFTLANVGNVVGDTLTAMASGATAVIQVVVKVDPSVLSGTALSNTASLTTTSTDPNPLNDSSTASTTVSVQADVQIVKSAPAIAVASGALDYTLTVTNNGPSNAVDVIVTDTVPSGVTFVAQTNTSGPTFILSNIGNAVDDLINSLPPNTPAVITVSTTVNANTPGGAVLSNTANLTSTSTDPVASNNTSTATTTVDVPPAITSGATVTFTVGTPGSFNVTTSGFPAPALSVSGALPTNVTFVDNHNGTATLSGNPAAGTGGSYALTITAANGVLPNATQAFTLIVNEAPAITSAATTTFVVGAPSTFTVTAFGYPKPTLGRTGSLPGGVSFIDNLNGAATLSGTPAAGSVGTYPLTITAANGVGSNATQSFSLVVSKAGTSTALITSLSPTVFGQAVTFTATVTTPVSGAGVPTGTVTFSDGATSLGTGTLNGAGVATLTTSSLAVASHSITAAYGGDGNFNTSASSAVSQVVNKAATTTALTSSVNPSVFGQSVTFTATVSVTAPGAGIPSGTVTFLDGATSIGTGTLSGSGVATLTTSSLAVASHSITASYGGDTSFNTSTSSAVSQVVNKASTTTALISSANPSVFGQSVTFTATVTATAPGAGTPSGTVTFLDGATSIGTGTLNGSGVATFTTSGLAVATHSITASYGGDTSFNTSTSSAVSQVVNQAATTTALVSSANPSVFGQSVTFTATVTATAPGAGTPSGTVTFLDGATSLGTGTLNGAGVATLTTSSLTVATHPITASYGADTNFSASTSSAVSQVVNKASTTTALTSSANPSVFGQSVTFTATVSVTAPGAGLPTGTVNFLDGSTTIGSGTLNGSGVATFSTASLAVATHSITAVYVGDTSFSTSTSSAVSQVVNQASTSTALVSSVNPSVFGQSVTFTATVTVTGLGAGLPTGTVTFLDGATSIGTGTLNGSGVATLTTASLAVATHPITASYGGDASFSASISSAVSQVVNQASTSTALTSSANPSVFGQSVTFTATVTVSAPGAGTPGGTVTFLDGSTNIGTGTLNASGVATLTLTNLAVGTHSVTATYGGDASFSASAPSTAVSQVVNAANTATALAIAASTGGFGNPITLTATVTAVTPGSGTPSGSVTFRDGATVLGTVALNASGVAVFSTSSLAPGNHSISATFTPETASYLTSSTTQAFLVQWHIAIPIIHK